MKSIVLPIVILLAGATLANAQQARGPQGPSKYDPQHRPTPQSLATKLLADFDANQDGSLDHEELAKAVRAMHRRHRAKTGACSTATNAPANRPPPPPPAAADESGHRHLPPPAEGLATNWLSDFDVDDNGQLNEAELTEALASLPPPPPPPAPKST